MDNPFEWIDYHKNRIAKWDKRFLSLAEMVASWSKDPSTKTGAVITTTDHRVVSLGFNGFPRGVDDSDERLNNRELKYAMIVHCERNAVVLAGKNVDGCTLYTWPFGSCTPCAALMIQAGIKRVVAPRCPETLRERWGEDLNRASAMYLEADVSVVNI